MLADARPVLGADAAATWPGRCRPWRRYRCSLLDDPATVAAVDAMPDPAPTDADRASPLRLTIRRTSSTPRGRRVRPKGVVVSHAGWPASRRPRWTATRCAPGTGCCSSPRRVSTRRCWSCACRCRWARRWWCRRRVRCWVSTWPRCSPSGRVTHALIPPAALATVPAEVADRGVPEFRTVIVGGDACTAELVARWAPGRRMINSYGPTESTVVSTWSRAAGRRRGARRSAGRSGTPGCTCSTPSCGRCRSGCRASCTSPGPGWPAAT